MAKAKRGKQYRVFHWFEFRVVTEFRRLHMTGWNGHDFVQVFFLDTCPYGCQKEKCRGLYVSASALTSHPATLKPPTKNSNRRVRL